eukprot:COSAG06_NODE_71540_length_182_cov_225.783133_1_plen_41_part_01
MPRTKEVGRGGGGSSVDGSGQSRKPPRPMPNATTARTKVLC